MTQKYALEHAAFNSPELPEEKNYPKWKQGKCVGKGPGECGRHNRGAYIDPDTLLPVPGKFNYVPRLPYEWWIDPAGFVMPLVIGTNQNAKDSPSPKYEHATKARARADGWIPYYEVPFRNTPDGNTEQWCPLAQWPTERQKLIDERQKAHAKEMSRYTKVSKNSTASVVEAQTQAMTQLGEMVAKAVTAAAGDGKRK